VIEYGGTGHTLVSFIVHSAPNLADTVRQKLNAGDDIHDKLGLVK
jgi:hypothetical protein